MAPLPDGTVEEFVEVDEGVRLRVLSRGEARAREFARSVAGDLGADV